MVFIDVNKVKEIIEKDIKEGLIPFFLGLTIGGTGLGATDPITEIVKITKEYNMFVNVDAAWAGTAFYVPELRQELEGLKHVDSIMMNYGKWGMGGMPGAMMFVADRDKLIESMEGKAPKP